MIQDTLIYEYENSFFIIQRGQQGKNPNTTAHQRASENTALFSQLSISCSYEELGNATIGVLEHFDTIPPQYDPWETKELNKLLYSWVGAKNYKTLERNSRLVQVIRNQNNIEIIPFDNYNKYKWYAPMSPEDGYKSKIIKLALDVSSSDIGKSIFKVFEFATYNPEKKE
jgi:hypothetical protein